MLLFYLRHFHKPEIYGKGYTGLIKQGFYETPYLTLAMLCMPIPFFGIPLALYRYEKLDGPGRRYVHRYTIFRPGHPHLKYFTRHNDRTKVSKPE